MTPQEYWDSTLYELSIRIEGYNRRWEEQWRHTRKLYTLLYNINAEKGKKKRDFELLPLPSEAQEIAWQRKMSQMKEGLKLEQESKRGQNGSGISS